MVKFFSERLVTLMIENGFASEHSRSGVKVTKLADVCGCSIPMARRYVLGDALPDIEIIYKIAQWLNVNPGWLLFGEGVSQIYPANANLIQIDPDLLKYILVKSAFLFELLKNKEEVVGFVLDIISDINHLEAGTDMIKKVIDMSISSTLRFKEFKNDNFKIC